MLRLIGAQAPYGPIKQDVKRIVVSQAAEREVGDDVTAPDGYLRPVPGVAGVCNGGHDAPPDWRHGRTANAGNKLRDFLRDSERPFGDFGAFLFPSALKARSVCVEKTLAISGV